MPKDSPQLRENLAACLPSLVIEDVAAESGQRVVYFGHFEDALISVDVIAGATDEPTNFLVGWENWGRVVIKVVADASAEALGKR